MTSEKKLWVALIAVAIIAITGLFTPIKSAVEQLGAAGTRFIHGISVNTTTSPTANGLKVGSNGSEIVEMKATTCEVKGDDSVTATSSAYAYCTGVTGIASGDVVFAQLSTTTSNTIFGGWAISSAKASTTAGSIDFRLYNGTGADAVPSATSVGSSTNIWYIDN